MNTALQRNYISIKKIFFKDVCSYSEDLVVLINSMEEGAHIAD